MSSNDPWNISDDEINFKSTQNYYQIDCNSPTKEEAAINIRLINERHQNCKSRNKSTGRKSSSTKYKKNWKFKRKNAKVPLVTDSQSVIESNKTSPQASVIDLEFLSDIQLSPVLNVDKQLKYNSTKINLDNSGSDILPDLNLSEFPQNIASQKSPVLSTAKRRSVNLSPILNSSKKRRVRDIESFINSFQKNDSEFVPDNDDGDDNLSESSPLLTPIEFIESFHIDNTSPVKIEDKLEDIETIENTQTSAFQIQISTQTNASDSNEILNSIESLPFSPLLPSSSTNSPPVFNISETKKTKTKFKKGTLSYRLQELLRAQKADIAIWKHEQYLKDSEQYIPPKLDDEHLIMHLSVEDFWSEYNKQFLKCIDNTQVNYLLIVNSNVLQEPIQKQSRLLVYPPYILREFIINDVKCKTLLNVNKIKFEK